MRVAACGLELVIWPSRFYVVAHLTKGTIMLRRASAQASKTAKMVAGLGLVEVRVVGEGKHLNGCFIGSSLYE